MSIMSGVEFENGIKLGFFHSRGKELDKVVKILKEHRGEWSQGQLYELAEALGAYLQKKGFVESQVGGKRDLKTGTVTELRRQVAKACRDAGLMPQYVALTTLDERTTGGELSDQFYTEIRQMEEEILGPPPPDNDPAWRAQCKESYNQILMRVEQKNRMTSRLAALLNCLEPALDLRKTPPTREEVCHEVREALARTHVFKKSVKERYGDLLEKLETAARKGLFHAELHIGCENELSGTTIILAKAASVEGKSRKNRLANDQLADIAYGIKLARTKTTTPLGIAYTVLEVEGAGATTQSAAHKGKDGLIEHITGPLTPYGNPSDHDRAMAALAKLRETLLDYDWEVHEQGGFIVEKVAGVFFPLADVLRDYNAKLSKNLKDFELEEVTYGGYRWYVAVAPERGISAGTQVNFEVPLCKLVTDDFASLFDARADLYKACRERARLALEGVGMGGPENVRIHALLSLFFYEALIMAWIHGQNAFTGKPMEAGTSKNQYGLLPKTGVNDLIRVLTGEERRNIREKLLPAMPAAEARLIADEWKVLEPLNRFAAPPDLQTYRDWCFKPGASCRYENESTHRYGNGVKPTCSTRDCRRPRGHPGAHGDYASRAEKPFSGSGKPLPVGVYRVTKGIKKDAIYEPILVFEARNQQDVFVRLGKDDMSPEQRSEQLSRLEKAQRLG